MTKEEHLSPEYFSAAAGFGSLLPWMTPVGRFAMGNLPVPDARRADVQGAELTLAALRVFERLLRQFFDDSPVSVAVFDQAGRLLRVNRAFGAMLGYATDDLIERNIDELVHPDDVPFVQERRRLLVEGKCDRFQLETRFGTGCRRQIWTRMFGRLARDEDGGAPNIFAHLVDFTELNPFQQILRRDAEEARLSNSDPDRYM